MYLVARGINIHFDEFRTKIKSKTLQVLFYNDKARKITCVSANPTDPNFCYAYHKVFFCHF